MRSNLRTDALAWCLAVLFCVSTAVHGSERLVFVPDQTQIEFELGATLHTVKGTAALLPSTLEFDRELKTCDGRVTIDATSLVSGNDRRDRVMHSKVLQSEDFPSISLICRSYSGDIETGSIEVAGEFEILGETHPLEVGFEVSVADGTLGLSSTFEVPYVLWGLKNPSKPLLRVKKFVVIRLEAEASWSRETPETGL